MSTYDPPVSPLPRDFEVDPGPVKARVAMGVGLMATLGTILTLLVVTSATLSAGHVKAGAPVDLSMVRTTILCACVFLAGMIAWLAAITFFAVPRMRFHVGARRFEIHTLFGDRRWETAGLRARKHVPDVQGRIFGTGMAGYMTGWFLVDGKKTLVYATSKRDGVLLEDEGSRVFITPVDPEAMLDSLRIAGAAVERGREAR